MSLLTNLISSWELNEAASNALDSHGSNTLTPTGGAIGAAAGPGGVGGSRDFESGDTEWFAIPDNASVSTGDIDFTIETWVNIESLTGADQDIVSKYETSGNQREYRLFYNSTSARFSFAMSSTGTSQSGAILANGTPSTGTWYQLIAWHDATNNEMGIAVNAEASPATSSYSSGVFDGTASFQLGARGTASPAAYFDGLISKTRLWKRILTSQERTDLYNGGNGLAYTAFGGSDVSTTATVQSMVVNLITPSVSTSVNFAASAQSITLNTNTNVVSGDSNYVASAASITFNLISPTISSEAIYGASAQSITVNIVSSSVTTGVAHTASPISLTYNVQTNTILTEVSYEASPILLTVNLLSPEFNNSLIHEAETLSITINTVAPSVNTGSTFSASPLNINFNSVPSSLSVDSVNSVNSQSLIINAISPAVLISISSLANVAVLQTALGTASILTGSVISANTASLTFGLIHPTRVSVDNTGGDSGNLFDLTSMQNILKRGYDSLINVLGTPCVIYYPPIWEPCSNCLADVIGNKSSNRYKHGGPVPFQVGSICPACSGNGKRAKETTESSKFLTAYDPKKFFYPVPTLDVRQPYAVIQLEGFLTDLPKLRRAEYVIIHADIKGVAEGRYRLSSEAFDDNNIVQGRYFFCTMEKV
jgi:hypothetical protein